MTDSDREWLLDLAARIENTKRLSLQRMGSTWHTGLSASRRILLAEIIKDGARNGLTTSNQKEK